jgi:Glucose-6-phosphate dehydrogenase, C-terminal domain
MQTNPYAAVRLCSGEVGPGQRSARCRRLRAIALSLNAQCSAGGSRVTCRTESFDPREPLVDPKSRTPIEVMEIASVPFFIRAGKSLPLTCTEVIARLRSPPRTFPHEMPANYLRFRINPTTELAMGLNVMDEEESGEGATAEMLASRHPGSNPTTNGLTVRQTLQ